MSSGLRYLSFGLCVVLLLLQNGAASFDYGDALTKSLLYFEAQRSGKLPPHQRVQWRGDSALRDGNNAGINLVGGYYDAGDNVKFGLPMAFTVTMLAWSVVQFGPQLEARKELWNALNAIKWGTDYMIKAHPEPNVLYGQVGEGGSNHACWQRPEDMTTPRPAYKIDAQHPGSDLAAETAAALAAASIAFNAHGLRTYSSTLLNHAKQKTVPTSLHRRWAVAAAQKRKHVLLEKPVALNAAELDEILAACESGGVQYMDATMWVHHPRTAEMEAFLADQQRFGRLKAIHCIFSHCVDQDFLKNDIRVKPDLDALGVLGDAGWYCIRASLWAVNYRLPKTVTAFKGAELNEAGVILSCGASLLFPDGEVATFYCSFLSNLTMEMSVLGVNGFFRLHDFIIPFQENVGAFYVNSNTKFAHLSLGIEPEPTKQVARADLPQEALMVKEFASLVTKIRDHGSESEKKWPTISRKTQLVVDAVKASIDKGYVAVEIVE